MLEQRNIRNKTADGYDDRALNLAGKDDRSALFQNDLQNAQITSEPPPQNIHIHDNKDNSYQLSNITTLTKDQVSLSLKRDKSNSSSLNKKGSKNQLQSLRSGGGQ